MKLTHIRIKDFRSFVGEHDFDVSTGANYVVGPNNCGKSNLIAALELALDPDARYDPERDRPVTSNGGGAPPQTRITLTFEVGVSGPEGTLLTRAHNYELSVRKSRSMPTVGPIKTYASAHEVRLATVFRSGGTRQTLFRTKAAGGGASSAESDELIALESQFRKVVRFAVIHSGEDIENLLKGKFREVLQMVINDHLKEALEHVRTARQEYVDTLQSELLEPLRSLIGDGVAGIFPEITDITLIPDIPGIDDTLSSVDVQLGDTATTGLKGKGTGVRGVVLLSMLRYLADQSRRSLVLAVEEPEAFLHPGAQEEIGAQLGELAARHDVSLLVTTHSPYVISREPDVLITELHKSADGATSLSSSVHGDDSRVEVLGSLYRDAGMASVLERAVQVPPDARAVLVVEGYTDKEFLTIGCESAGRPELLSGLHIIHANSAQKVVFQSVLVSSATDKPVVALLDFDEHGKAAATTLEKFGWRKNREIIVLNEWPGKCLNGSHDIEIEDLLPEDLKLGISHSVGLGKAHDRTERCGDRTHIYYSSEWKTAALAGLEKRAKGQGMSQIVWLAELVNERVQAVIDARARKQQHLVGTSS